MLYTAIVRAAVSSDFDQITLLYERFHRDDKVWDPKVMARRWRELLAFNGATVFVCEYDGVLVSTCTLVVVPNMTQAGRPYGLIENVVTHADHHRRGFGKMTLEAALQSAWDRDCYKVMLLSGKTNLNAHKFYESLGFDRTRLGFQIRLV